MKLPCHQECKCHGFLGLVQWCRHPAHLEPIESRRRAIEAAGGQCGSYVDWEAKVHAGRRAELADACRPAGNLSGRA